VSAVGVDETAFLRATGGHPTLFATGIADLTPGRPARLLDGVHGRSGTVLGGWLARRDEQWWDAITTASLDPFRGYETALTRHLPDAVRVLDPFHVTRPPGHRLCGRRPRRVQQETTGHCAGPATRCTGCAGCCAAATTGSARGPGDASRPGWKLATPTARSPWPGTPR
jgi:transposase